MAIQTKYKDPTAILDFGFNWANWLASGETISGSTWTVSSGVTKTSSSTTTTTTTIWLSNGVSGSTYTVSNAISTSAYRTDERSMIIEVMDR